MAAREVGSHRVSPSTHQVLAALLGDPGADRWFALDLCRRTGLSSGTVARILLRMEQLGWVESRWEHRAEASSLGRPRRRFYRLTGTGRRVAWQATRQPPPPLIIWTQLS